MEVAMLLPQIRNRIPLDRTPIRLPIDAKCPVCGAGYPAALQRSPCCGVLPFDRGGGAGDR
jgi:hypothetical protein